MRFRIWRWPTETDPFGGMISPDSPLRSLTNVIITPHIAGPTIDARWMMGDLVVASRIKKLQNLGRPTISITTFSTDGFRHGKGSEMNQKLSRDFKKSEDVKPENS